MKKSPNGMVLNGLLAVLVSVTTALGFALASYGGLSAKSYVADGLIGHWDGVENVKYGAAHDPSATTWTELTGLSPNITVPSGASFSAKGLDTIRANGFGVSPVVKAPLVFNAFAEAKFTVELAIDKTSVTTSSSTAYPLTCKMLILGSESYWIGTRDDNQFGFNPNDDPNEGWLKKYVTVDTTVGKWVFSCSQDGTDCQVRANDVSSSSAVSTTANPPSKGTGHGFAFNRSWFTDKGMNGTYHGIRIYDRALSADEAAVNRAVDEVRFFGADATAYPLPDGWRFDVAAGGDVTLMRRCLVAASVSDGGTVSVNGGTAAESAEVWVEQGVGAMLTVTAVPAAGYEFVCWRGVVSDGLWNASAELKVAGDVTAVFRKVGTHRLSARSYVQDGLLAQWDGEYNGGYDAAHDDAATSWTELTGNGPDITVPSDASFMSTGLRTTWRTGSPEGGNNGKQYSAPALLAAFSNASITAEVAFNKTAKTPVSDIGQKKALGKFFILGSDGFWAGTSGDTSIGWNCNGANGTDGGSGGELMHKKTVPTTIGGHTLSCSQSGVNWTVRFDDLAPAADTTSPRNAPTDKHGFRFNRCWYEHTGLDGFYHSIRFYGRPLTAEEAQINRAVDRVRFFGAEPADCVLPTGWRFDTTDGIALERICTAGVSLPGGGTITVDGGEATESADIWAEYGGVGTALTLSAVPAAGYRFVRWRGVADEAEARAPTGVKHVTGDVVAVFCRDGADARRLSARSYVQDGLIAQWDGEYNQGYDVEHNDAATTWTELTGNGPSITVPTDASFASMGLRTTWLTGSPESGGNYGRQYPAPALLAAFSNASITVEVAFNKTEKTPKSDIGYANELCKFFILGDAGFWIGTSGDTSVGWNCNGANGTDGGSGGYLLSARTVPTTLGEHTLSCSQSDTDWTVRFDELDPKTGTNVPRTVPNTAHGFRFNRCWYEKTGLDGFYHSMRFYNRPLSADEAQVNRAVDRVRFFGADPAACELPEGWRFDMSDGICLEKVCTASAAKPERGMVSVDGGAAGESVPMWAGHGSSAPVTLTAVPKDGFKFHHWEGAISGADLTKASGEFEVWGDVTAVFHQIGLTVIVR